MLQLMQNIILFMHDAYIRDARVRVRVLLIIMESSVCPTALSDVG